MPNEADNSRPPGARITARSALLCAAFFCALCGGCGERESLEHTARLYGRWFIEPTASHTDSLLKTARYAEGLPAVAEKCISLARLGPGPGSAVLRDIAGTEWALGYTTPARFNADTVYPLVIYLHGGIGSATSDKGRLAWEMLAPLVDSCQAFLASPTAIGQTPWWSPSGMRRIQQALRYMTLHFPIDPERVVLAGVSDGALGCYAASNVMAGPFAGFIAISGFGGVLESVGITPVPGNMAQRPIYNVNAANDRLFPLAQVNAFLDRMATEGVAIDRRVYPDERHGFDYRDKEMGALAHRIRFWKRPAGRTGISWRIHTAFPWRTDNLVAVTVAPGTSGLPAINAWWERGRLTIQSIGIRSFVFMAEKHELPPVVVANGRAEERCRDISGNTRAILDAVQQQCRPGVPRMAIYSVTIHEK